MSGMIGITAQDNGRYNLFPICLSQLRHPPNTALEWALTSDRILGRNRCVKKALEVGAEWLLFLDDDHAFSPDLLTRLLAHKVPMVGSLYLQRMQPFAPVAFGEKTEDERYIPLMLSEHPTDALVEVAAIGTGGMLIRSEILRAMKEPWFEHGRASEDLIFCDKVYELGLGPIYCDLGSRMGHLTISAIWPTDDGEDWQIGFAVADGCNLTVPMPKIDKDADTPSAALTR